MAESQSLTTAEVVPKTPITEHADFLREVVAVVAREPMEAEISSEIGAGRGEVSADRSTHRNGYRTRVLETRVGELELLVFPRNRSGVSLGTTADGSSIRCSWSESTCSALDALVGRLGLPVALGQSTLPPLSTIRWGPRRCRRTTIRDSLGTSARNARVPGL
jgi:hypothetical protein